MRSPQLKYSIKLLTYIYINFVTHKMQQSLLFVWWFYRQRLPTLVDQGYTLTKLKIWFRTFYGIYNDLLQHYNTLPFAVFVWPSPLLMCVTSTYTGFDWIYSWFHGMCVATADAVYSCRHLLAHWGFPERLCCLGCNIFSRLCYVCGLMILD